MRPTLPASKPNHFIKFFPLGKGIIGRMHHHQITPILHILHKGILSLLQPRFTVVIGQHDIVLAKIGFKISNILLGDNRTLNAESSGCIKGINHYRRTSLPVTIILSIHQKYTNLRPAFVIIRKGYRRKQRKLNCDDSKNFKSSFKHIFPWL